MKDVFSPGYWGIDDFSDLGDVPEVDFIRDPIVDRKSGKAVREMLNVILPAIEASDYTELACGAFPPPDGTYLAMTVESMSTITASTYPHGADNTENRQFRVANVQTDDLSAYWAENYDTRSHMDCVEAQSKITDDADMGVWRKETYIWSNYFGVMNDGSAVIVNPMRVRRGRLLNNWKPSPMGYLRQSVECRPNDLMVARPGKNEIEIVPGAMGQRQVIGRITYIACLYPSSGQPQSSANNLSAPNSLATDT